MVEPKQTEPGREGQDLIELFVPWSARLTFSEEVCGLPGTQRKCRTDCAALSCPPNANETAWLLFSLPSKALTTSDPQCKAQSFASKPEPPRGEHYVVCAVRFTTEQRKRINQPMWIECAAWIENDATWRTIDRWDAGSDASRHSLVAVFGSETFIPHAFPEINETYSIADLIDACLDQSCRFRGGSYGRAIGITRCKTEDTLSALGLLDRLAIHFTYIEPALSYLNIRTLPDFQLGVSTGTQEAQPQPASTSSVTPVRLKANLKPERITREHIAFADCFTGRGRQHALPSEVTRSFLCFPIGEVATYLLHWLFLRVLAQDANRNAGFHEAFSDWWQSVSEKKADHETRFRSLLTQTIDPLDDARVYSRPTGSSSSRFLAFEGPVSLYDALKMLELAPGIGDHLILHLTGQFLATTFAPDRIGDRDGLAMLPMYRYLEWSYKAHLVPMPSDVLNAVVAGQPLPLDETSAVRCLEAVLATIVSKSKLYPHMAPVDASAELRKHTDRSVFPIGDVLEHWPRNVGMTHYWILPLWEDWIHGHFRPVVFAHVFGRPANGEKVHFFCETTSAGCLDLQQEGARLQSCLLPLGSAIVHHYYEQLKSNQEAMRGEMKAGATLAHDINSLFSKRFSNLHAKMEGFGELTKELKHAWDIIRSSADLAWMKAKVATHPGDAALLQNAQLRFLAPFKGLQVNQVLEAIRHVAEHVYATSNGNPRNVLSPLSKQVPEGAIDAPLYSRCHMLVAEMIDNFCHYGDGVAGTWTARVHGCVLIVRLHQPEYERLPDSDTFAALGALVRGLSLGDARTQWVEGKPGTVEWVLEVDLSPVMQHQPEHLP